MAIAMIMPTTKNVSMMVEIVVVLASMQNIAQHVSALVTSQLVMVFPMVIMEMVFAMMNSTPLNAVLTVLIAAVTTFSVIIVLNVLATVIFVLHDSSAFQKYKNCVFYFMHKSKCNLAVIRSILGFRHFSSR
jgi:hypothetical protein